jgi:xanthine dehydrogenase small subunit
MATLAGNIANASPIGDMTIFFLALDSSLTLRSGDQRRTVALREFFRGYKDTALEPDEEIESVEFAVPENGDLFSFEKVSKRTCLDIASVNTAMSCRVQDGVIAQASVSAGGVAPIPLYLEKTSAFLVAKMLDAATVREAADIADGEIAPISDVRGSAAYKRLLFRQLFYAHFIVHCEGVIEWGELL